MKITITQAEQKARELIKRTQSVQYIYDANLAAEEIVLLIQKAEQYSELETLIKCDSHSKGLDTPIDVLYQLVLTLKELKEKADALDWLEKPENDAFVMCMDKGILLDWAVNEGKTLLSAINQARKA